MNHFKANMKWLGGFYKPFKLRLWGIALQSILVAALTAAMPYIYIRIIDGIQEHLSAGFIIKSVGILLVLGLLNFGFSVTNATRRAKTNLELEWHFRQKTFAKLIRMDQSFFTRFRLGDVVTRLTDDVGRKLSWFACSGIFRAFESVLKFAFCLTVMVIINPGLTLIAVAPFPFQVLLYIKSAAILDQRFGQLQKAISRVNEMIESCFSGIRIIQAYCAEKRQAMKFAEVARDRAESEISAEKTHIFVHQLYGYFWQLAQVLILMAGGWMVVRGELTVGEFVAFDYYILYLVWPMFDIGGLMVGYRRAAVSIGRLRELDEFSPLIVNPPDPLTPSRSSGQIVFQDVTFTRTGRAVVDRVSFDIGSHRMIAIVGEIGSGKSTLLQLICRFFDPDSGIILLDGTPLYMFNLTDLRQRIGYISQEPLLFTDTVENNIRFGRNWIDTGKIIEASALAQLTDDVCRFNSGFQTPIGLRGMNVSGGQKQRISIARALAGDPVVLVMDDATAHLDAETENVLWNRICSVLPRIRTFVTTHRTSTLERADMILVMKNGQLVETGVHPDLLDRKGEYHRIYSRQKIEETIMERRVHSESAHTKQPHSGGSG
ncbi:ABC transporter ATP-binding protein [bacterium]|nr:ABC transporter ATP-binding protein [candidate division CSSED10-310 bacterium]